MKKLLLTIAVACCFGIASAQTDTLSTGKKKSKTEKHDKKMHSGKKKSAGTMDADRRKTMDTTTTTTAPKPNKMK